MEGIKSTYTNLLHVDPETCLTTSNTDAYNVSIRFQNLACMGVVSINIFLVTCLRSILMDKNLLATFSVFILLEVAYVCRRGT